MDMSKVTRFFNKVKFEGAKHSPEILIITGVVGVVASTVLACKATTKLGDILEESKEKVNEIHEAVNDPVCIERGYTEEDQPKDLAIVHTQTAIAIGKLYAPAVILGGLSLGCIIGSNHILRQRNAVLTTAYAALDARFGKYRANVVERFGEKIDQELRYNVKKVPAKDENGNEDPNTQVEVADIENSDYSRFFDEASEYWKNDASYNFMFVRQIERWANNKLVAEGYLFLNEVYEALGIEKTPEGQLVGWIYQPNDTQFNNFISFKIYDYQNERKRAFVNGYEPSILLDFNVDGNIWKLMK